jgi:soluble lytic murein transglycosylase-like protein
MILWILLIFNTVYAQQDLDAYRAKYTKYDTLIVQNAHKYDLPIHLIKAIIKVESNWNENAMSKSHCVGLMQVLHGSKDPEKNINQGCMILKRGLKTSYARAIAAYRGKPLNKCRKYVNKVIETWIYYDMIN